MKLVNKLKQYESKDWIKFSSDGKIFIGEIEYLFKNNIIDYFTKTEYYAKTNFGTINLNNIVEHRKHPYNLDNFNIKLDLEEVDLISKSISERVNLLSRALISHKEALDNEIIEVELFTLKVIKNKLDKTKEKLQC